MTGALALLKNNYKVLTWCPIPRPGLRSPLRLEYWPHRLSGSPSR
jgi:hypothetical protein